MILGVVSTFQALQSNRVNCQVKAIPPPLNSSGGYFGLWWTYGSSVHRLLSTTAIPTAVQWVNTSGQTEATLATDAATDDQLT